MNKSIKIDVYFIVYRMSSYCPDCGKKATNEYMNFCGFCGANMKDLGVKVAVAAAPAPAPKPPVRSYTPEPQMHSYAPTAPMSRIERLRAEREEKRLAAASAATNFGPPDEGEEEQPDDGSPRQANRNRGYDGVNLQVSPDYDRLLANGLELELDENALKSNTEKMQFSLPS